MNIRDNIYNTSFRLRGSYLPLICCDLSRDKGAMEEESVVMELFIWMLFSMGIGLLSTNI